MTSPMIFWLLVACHTDPDPCPAAWQEMQALATSAQPAIGPTMKAPQEAAFLDACHELPAPARACLSVRHHLEDPDGCKTALAAVPDDVKKDVAKKLAP